MAAKTGWRRQGSKGHFRYVDSGGGRVTDEVQLERIRRARDPAGVEGRLDRTRIPEQRCRRPATTPPDENSTSTTPIFVPDRSRRNTTS